MDQIDTKVFALIAAGTTAAIGAVKKFFPKWTDGKEEALAQVLPIFFVIVAKMAHAFKGTDWTDALLIAVGAGLGAGVIHDYALNPVIKGVKTLTGTKPPA